METDPFSGPTQSVSALAEQPGTVVGHYKLLEQIGEGGFGVVFLADQKAPIQRRVAVKIVKAGMDSKEVIARFEAERQALALMDHPCIAKVLDGGTTASGRPYFVMELVRGVPVTEYCDEKHLTPQERLELFVPICQAVQHAHQKGIIHRDLKPSNILVAEYDGQRMPKIIDFGVAKALHQELTAKTVFTHVGQIIGTPEYMSPEQAKLNQLDIDTRSDIYSLGVLLYELLTGATPFDRRRLRSAAYDELIRIIREEDPPSPSNRLTIVDGLASIAVNRRTDPKKLRSIVHGELDWIVMKSIEKDRARRYDTANSFAEDVKRYLNHEPVLAGPPSWTYGLRKFARRHIAAMIAAVLVMVALLAGTVATARQAKLARDAERTALANLDLAVQAQRRAEEETHKADLARQRESQERQRADENFRRARRAVDEYFTLVADNTLLDEAGMAPLRTELLEAAIKYYDEFSNQSLNDPDVLAELAAVYDRITWIYASIGSPEFLDAYNRSLDILEKLLLKGDMPADWHSYAAGTFRFTFGNNAVLDRPEEILRAAKRGTKVFSELARANPQVVGFRHHLAANYWITAHLSNGQSKQDNFQQARRIWESLLHADPGNAKYAVPLADIHFHSGWALVESGKQAEAEKVFRDGIATFRSTNGDPWLGEMIICLAQLRYRSGALDESEKLFREANAIYRKLRDEAVDRSPRSMPRFRSFLGQTSVGLGRLLSDVGRPEEAQQAYDEAIATWRTLVQQEPTNVDYCGGLIDALTAVGEFYGKTGKHEEAIAVTRDAIEITEKYSAQFPGKGKNCWLMIGHTLWALAKWERPEEAEETLRRALKVFQDLSAEFPNEPYYRQEVASSQHYFGKLLQSVRRWQEALEAYRQALEGFQKLAAEFPHQPLYQKEMGAMFSLVGDAFSEMQQLDKARDAYRNAETICRSLVEQDPTNEDYRARLRSVSESLTRVSNGDDDLQKKE